MGNTIENLGGTRSELGQLPAIVSLHPIDGPYVLRWGGRSPGEEDAYQKALQSTGVLAIEDRVTKSPDTGVINTSAAESQTI